MGKCDALGDVGGEALDSSLEETLLLLGQTLQRVLCLLDTVGLCIYVLATIPR